MKKLTYFAIFTIFLPTAIFSQVSDGILNTMIDEDVILELDNGATVEGKLKAVNEENVIFIYAANGNIGEITKSSITDIRSKISSPESDNIIANDVEASENQIRLTIIDPTVPKFQIDIAP